MVFSPNVNPDYKKYMKKIINVRIFYRLESYLGLPAFLFRWKVQDFKMILDRVWATLQGWKNKLF